MGCRFLDYLDVKRWSFMWQVETAQNALLELLNAKQHQAVLDMVKSGEVSPKEPLPGMQSSLLHLAMRRDFNSRPVVEDVAILLDAVVARGETLDENDFREACCSKTPGLIREFLARGAKVTCDSLHHLIHRSTHQTESEMFESATLLLEARAELDGLGSKKLTPLTTAALEIGNNSVHIMRWLLDQRADPNGAGGQQSPLQAHLASWAKKEGIQVLVERRADVNQRDRLGRTPIHIALSGHAKLDLAKQLKTLGADPFAEDADGLTPSQIILRRHSKPQQAADFEDRPMNEEEQRWIQAMKHPATKMFENSPISSIGWVISRCPDDPDGFSGGGSASEGEEEPREEAIAKLRIPDILNGRKPKTVVLNLPLTRYSELRDDLVLPCPPEGFTLKDLLKKIYEYYQAPFDEGQLRRIRQHYGESQLGDTFGYIRANVNPEEDDGDAPEDAENPTKKQRVPRLSLRGDSIFFEGFHGCKYFEDEKKLYAEMSLGS